MTPPSLAIQYHRAAYTETLPLASSGIADAKLPRGLMGREVASSQFLSALLKSGRWSRIDALLGAESDREGLKQQCTELLRDSRQRRHVRIIPPSEIDAWVADPPSELLHFPFPPDSAIAWRRHRQAAHGFAISGVTHTLCSLPAIESLWRYLAAPFEHYDRLICTSRAVHVMVQDTVGAMIERIADTTGRQTGLQVGLELCPLGVDLDLHKPATVRDRFEARRRLGITDDRLVLLFAGRLSHHSKSQPLPMFIAAQQLAEQSSRDVCLVLCGWFSSETVRQAFEATARRIAPQVRLFIVDGLDPWWRMHAWDTADIFVSLADSIQETFGLTPLEAMARGICVVASDWNGYRDIVEHGKTGYLVPTAMVRNSNRGLTAELIRGSITYDQFLARVGQTVSVSIADACESLLALGTDATLRSRFGQAGRERAARHFGWSTVIAAYESIWAAQRHELNSARDRHDSTSVVANLGTPHYPEVERCFGGYPTTWIRPDQGQCSKCPSLETNLAALLSDPLCNHSLAWSTSFEALSRCLAESPQALGTQEWMRRLEAVGMDDSQVPNALAWLIKYGLLIATGATTDPSATLARRPMITFVITCKGRLDDLMQTLPVTKSQPHCAVIVVDYSCPQNSGEWVRQVHPSVQVISVAGKERFDRSDAKNTGAFAADTEWVCLLDADIVLSHNFVQRVTPLLRPGAVVRSDKIQEGTGGTFLCEKKAFVAVGGHDPVFWGWGEQDEDLVDALRFAGGSLVHYPANLLTHLDHDDIKRTQFHDEKTRAISHTINRVYRSMKWDWSRICGAVPPLAQRQRLHHQIAQQIRQLSGSASLGSARSGSASLGTIEIELGNLAWNPLRMPCERVLQYRLGSSPELSGGFSAEES